MTSSLSPKQSKQFSNRSAVEKSLFLVIGKLRRPHGVCGEMLMEVLTDFPERITPGVLVFVGPQQLPLKVRSRRWHRNDLLIAFEGYDTPEEVGIFRNQYIQVSADDRPPLPQGEFYHHQLLGLRVFSEQDDSLGEITEILSTGANDVLVVSSEKHGEILIPFIDDAIVDVNLERGEMRVHLLPGLLG